MRHFILLSLLLLASTGCSTPSPAPPQTVSPREPKSLDDLLPIARQQAAERFDVDETTLWFSRMQCRYAYHPPEQDAANPLRWYTFQFFDPDSVQPDPNNPRNVNAVGYSIKLTPDGRYKGSSHGRGMGWGR